MKTISHVCILLCLMAGSYQASALTRAGSNIKADTAVSPSKDKLSKDLIQLRDSINVTLSKIDQKSSKSTASYRKVLTKGETELSLRKTEVEKVLDEVVISTERTWDENLRIRAIQSLRDGRRDYYRVLDDIKQAMSSGSSR